MDRKRYILSGVAVVVIVALVVGGGYLFQSSQQNSLPKGVLGQVASYQVKESDVDPLMAQAKVYGKSKADVVSILLDNEMYGMAADKLHVPQISDQAVDAQLTSEGVDKSSFSSYLIAARKHAMYEQSLAAALTKSTKGKYIIAHFDGHIPNPNLPTPPDDTPSAQASDKAYAQALINRLSAAVQDKSMTFDQALAAEEADPRLGQAATPTMIQSGDFDTSDQNSDGWDAVHDKSTLSALDALGVGEVSKPLTGTVVFGSNNDHNANAVPGFYLIAQVTSRQSGNATYNDLAALTKAYKSTYNYRESVQ